MTEFTGYSINPSIKSLSNKQRIDDISCHISESKFTNIRTFDDVNYLKSLNVGKYKITIEYIEDTNISHIVNIVEKTKLAQKEFFNMQDGSTWGKIDGVFYSAYVTYATMNLFLSLDDIDQFKYFCVVALIPNNEYKITNITSKLIEIGKCTGVSVSKSKADKDAYVAFNTNRNSSNGIIFFKDKEHYAGLKLGIDPAIQLSGIYSL